mgnify:CR=1 FL=1
MKLFIFATAFATRTFLLSIKYMLNLKIDEILLLRENHSHLERNFNINILFSHNLDECVRKCDIALIIKEPNLSVKSLNYIARNAKKCIIIQNPWHTEEKIENYEDDNIFIHTNDCPVILNVASGKASQQFCGEILLNQIFFDNKISIRQVFSKATRLCLQELYNYGVLNSALSSQFDYDMPYNVFIYSLNFKDNWFQVLEYTELLKKLSPDYIILHISNSDEGLDFARNIIQSTCALNVNVLIRSHYALLDKTFCVYCDSFANKYDYIFDVEAHDLADKLSFDILSTIALPTGVNAL